MRVLVFITLCLAQTACATVVRGTHEDFKVSTQPAGATASSAALGLTSSGLTATTASGLTTVSGLAFSTGLFTTMFAVPVIAVDAASGSMLSLTPNPLEVDLTPINENEAPPAGAYDLDKLSDGDDTFK